MKSFVLRTLWMSILIPLLLSCSSRTTRTPDDPPSRSNDPTKKTNKKPAEQKSNKKPGGKGLFAKHCISCHKPDKKENLPENVKLERIQNADLRPFIRTKFREVGSLYHDYNKQSLPDRTLNKILNFLLRSKTNPGLKLYKEKGCASCHKIDLYGMKPDVTPLVHLRKRTLPAYLHQVLKNGTDQMPGFADLTPSERNDILTYLYGSGFLKNDGSPDKLERQGRSVFKNNCITCHRRTTADDPPSGLPENRHHPIEPPPLAGATRRYSRTLFDLVLDRGPDVMPSFTNVLSEEDRNALWAYADTLNNLGEPKGPTLLQKKPGIIEVEHPGIGSSEDKKRTVLTVDRVIQFIRQHVKKSKEKNNGFFPVTDKRNNTTIKLSGIKKIHKNRVSMLRNGNVFTCVDFNGMDGSLYDIDLFLTTKNGELSIQKTIVHKVDGTPRYNWTYEDGQWKRKPLD